LRDKCVDSYWNPINQKKKI